MWKLIDKPYPFNDDLKHNAKIIFFISTGVLVFLLLFQPIDYSAYNKVDIFYLITGLAASTFLTLSLNLIILPSLIPNLFFQNRWNIKKEILWNIWILITISTSDFLLYTKLFGIINIDFGLVGKILLLGFLPVCVLVIVNQDRLLRSHLKSAIRLSNKLEENKQIKDRLVFFESAYKKDSLSIKINTLLFVQSANNYINIFYKNGESIESHLVRCSLLKAEEILGDFDFVIRCHRNYIVNIDQISRIEGNSQGYKLYFENFSSPVLVSTKYLEVFKNLI